LSQRCDAVIIYHPIVPRGDPKNESNHGSSINPDAGRVNAPRTWSFRASRSTVTLEYPRPSFQAQAHL